MNLKLFTLSVCFLLFVFFPPVFSQQINDTTTLHTDEVIEENLEEDNLTDSTLRETLVMPFDPNSVPCAKIYPTWDNSTVNPYRVDLAHKTDTTLIDLTRYSHPVNGRITSNFGFRRWRWHYGIDLKVQVGDSIYSSFDGMVRIAKRSRTFGNYVVVRHNNGLETIYGHLSKILVNINQPIKAGEVIGLGGNTGRSTGPHLHYELRYLGNCLCPTELIDFTSGKVLSDTLLLAQKHFEYINEIRKVRYYVVRKGDTLGKIARKNGVSVAQLCKLNKIKRTTLLKIGRRLRYT